MEKLTALVISTYIAMVIYSQAFFIDRLIVMDGSGTFWNHLAILLVLVLLAYFAVAKVVSFSHFKRSTQPLKAVLLSVSLIGLIISILYHVIPLGAVYDLPAQMDTVFASDIAFTVWLILPLLALFI